MDKETKSENNKNIKETDDVHPISKANICSRLLFWWLIPLLRRGYSRDLRVNDMYKVKKEHSASYLATKLESAWYRELKQSKIKEKQPSLLKAFAHVFRADLLFYFGVAAAESILAVIEPVLLVQIISYFSIVPVISSREAYIYTAIFGLVVTTRQICLFHQFHHGGYVAGMKIRVAATAVIYRKALRLSGVALGQTTVGQIVNILSNDVNRFDQCIIYLPYLVVAPLQLIVVLGILWPAFGLYLLVVVFFCCLTCPFQVFMGKLFSKLRSKTALLTDERVRIMNEIISGMRVVKIYTWEKPFAELVRISRRNEVKKILRTSLLRGMTNSAFYTFTSIMSCVTFVTYALTGNPLLPSKVYLAIPLYSVVRFNFGGLLPSAVMYGTEARISIKRIKKFLELEEIQPSTIKDGVLHENGAYANKIIINNKDPEAFQSEIEEPNLPELTPEKGIAVRNLTSSWEEEEDGTIALDDISFSVSPGELLAVIGPVGCGKSSLLMALLSEMPRQSGSVSIQGKIGYTAQVPWVFSGTFRNNVLFGQPFDKSKYESIIKCCALKQDVERLPQGDLTLVGERGVTLSGGQRARVSLARAVYSNADVYLLDDPLSAVDTRVGRHLFEKCICGALADKARILITHQLQYLHSADKILILKKGKAVIGTYDELQESGIDFAALLKERKAEGEDTEETVDAFQRKRTASDASQISTMTLVSEEGNEDLGQISGEEVAIGSVDSNVYVRFFLAGCGILLLVVMVILSIAAQVVHLLSDWWLAKWTYAVESALNIENGMSSTNMTGQPTPSPTSEFDSVQYAWIYICLVVAMVTFSLTRTSVLLYMVVTASKNLHNHMFAAILRAPMQFFDTNPVGRILNRFAKDTGIIDDMLPYTMENTWTISILIVGIVIFLCVLNPVVLVFTIPIIIVFYFLRNFYLRSSRNIKRLEGITRSPVFSHLSATLQGLTTIRAFQAQEQFIEIFDSHQDLHTQAWHLFLCATRWLGVVTDALGVAFLVGVAYSCIIAADVFSLDSALVGLSLSYSLSLLGASQWGVRQSAEVENQMTSTERVLQYIDIEPEAPLETDHKPDADWPQKGRITLEGASLRYAKEGPDVLHSISCCIQAKEKVGIVGRTGAGKSSLMVALLRLAEPNGGITIDGIDISKVGLHCLRQNLSFIPQDPVLFSGTLRKNLDPFAKHADSNLWRALDEVQLKEDIESLEGGLETKMAEGGSNFSVGQRQLVCLARAILRQNKILIVDEATANVDLRTDNLIQATIRQRFRDCTVLTIAHRLNTVMDSDRILVLDNGRLVEFDTPYILLQKEDSLLTKMVLETGKTEAEQLTQMAKEKHDNKQNEDTKIKDTQDEDTQGHNTIDEDAQNDMQNEYKQNGDIQSGEQNEDGSNEDRQKEYTQIEDTQDEDIQGEYTINKGAQNDTQNEYKLNGEVQSQSDKQNEDRSNEDRQKEESQIEDTQGADTIDEGAQNDMQNEYKQNGTYRETNRMRTDQMRTDQMRTDQMRTQGEDTIGEDAQNDTQNGDIQSDKQNEDRSYEDTQGDNKQNEENGDSDGLNLNSVILSGNDGSTPEVSFS